MLDAFQVSIYASIMLAQLVGVDIWLSHIYYGKRTVLVAANTNIGMKSQDTV